MKIFTKKIFMLSAALMLSVGAFAQEAVTKHAYPEVKFTVIVSSSTTYDVTVPAWDAWEGYTSADGRYMVPGHLRVQKKVKNADGTFVGKYVTRFGTYGNNQLYVPKINNASSIKVKDVKINDVVVETGPVNLTSLTYSIVPEEDRLPNYGYTAKVFEWSTDARIGSSEDFTVPASFTHATTGDIYTIDEIDDYVFRQPESNTNSANWFEPNSITIPKEITKIGRGSFFMVPTKKVVFEEGNTINTIKEFNFQNCFPLEEITFPSSVTKLIGSVLGGNSDLKKITFASENPPAFEDFTWNGTPYPVFVTTYGTGVTHLDKCVISFPLKTTSINAYAAVNEFSNSLLASRVPLSASNMATCCVTKSFTTKQFDIQTGWVDGDLKAYQVKQDGVKEDRVVLTSIDNEKIPAEVGVVLKGSAGKEYEIFYLDNNANIDNMFKLELDPFNPVDNILEGVTEKTYMDMETIGGEDRSFFILSSNGSFLLVTSSGWLAANRAYLYYQGNMNWNFDPNARGLSVTLPEETGIAALETKSAQDDAWYTLQGVQVNQPSKGIFIKNGKKVVIK